MSTAGFWICPNCGMQVPFNTYHACTPKTYTGTYTPPWVSFSVDEETKALLRRIADALEKMTPLQAHEFSRNKDINE